MACVPPRRAVAYRRRSRADTQASGTLASGGEEGIHLRRLAIFVVHRRWLVLILTLIVLPIAAIFGSGAAAKLTVGGLEDPGSESARTAAELADHFAKSGQSDFVIVVHARKPGDVDSPAVVRQGKALTAPARPRARCHPGELVLDDAEVLRILAAPERRLVRTRSCSRRCAETSTSR